MNDLAKEFNEEEVEIPPTAYTNCPLHGDRYPLVNISKYCVPCSHFHGFFKQGHLGKTLNFARQYSVKCGLPVSRQITEVVN